LELLCAIDLLLDVCFITVLLGRTLNEAHGLAKMSAIVAKGCFRGGDLLSVSLNKRVIVDLEIYVLDRFGVSSSEWEEISNH
jgi:hypothetical protein